jgi:hypothetical protein
VGGCRRGCQAGASGGRPPGTGRGRLRIIDALMRMDALSGRLDVLERAALPKAPKRAK